MSATIPQLRMGFTAFDTLAPRQPVPGYGLRAYRPGDEDCWLRILNTGSLGAWDRARVEDFLSGEVPLDGIVFVTVNDEPVGSACLVEHRKEDGSVVPEVGWVVVHPDHQGHGLAMQLCRGGIDADTPAWLPVCVPFDRRFSRASD